MKTTVTHTTETVSGKEYPLAITRQAGPQEVEVTGEMVPVTAVTVFESPLGRSRCYTRAQPELRPEERARQLQTVREIAAQAMIDMRIW